MKIPLHLLRGVFACLILLGQSGLLAQSVFKLHLDHGQFKHTTTHQTYLELYYALEQSSLRYVQHGEKGYQGTAVIKIRIIKNDSLWVDSIWKLETAVVGSPDSVSRGDLVDLVRYVVEPGNYHIAIYAWDANEPAKLDSARLELNSSSFLGKNAILSDLELASSIKKLLEVQKSVFYRNSLMVIPNPSRIYTPQLPLLYYYYETYGLQNGIKDSVYKARHYVTDTKGERVGDIHISDKTRQKMGDSGVEVGAIAVGQLPTGVYHLHYGILDLSNQLVEEKWKRFFVYNPEKPGVAQHRPRSSQVIQGEFGSMDEPTLDQEIEYVKLILAKEEKKIADQLKTVEAKRQFLCGVWRRRDQDPSTLVNEFRQEYQKRLAYVNQKFRSFARPGWKTDRGRVYLKYGPPSDVEYFPSTGPSKPYEIWTYQRIQGGVIFVFADLQGFGEFILLHSTALGEVQNVDWIDLVRQ